MKKRQSHPTLEWYTAISARKGLFPRCPFTSVYRCPRFYQSLFLLGKAGSTEIDEKENNRLHEDWHRSDLWPTTMEQATSVSGREGNLESFSNFCPEVSFERFGLFATDLHNYVDEIDRSVAHSQLARERAGPEDPRWGWWMISPMHYSECPLYSPLQGQGSNPKLSRKVGF